MQRGLMMLLFGGVFTLLGLFMMPMRRANPKDNLVDNPIGWGLFGFGLSSLLVGITQSAKEKEKTKVEVKTFEYPVIKKEEKIREEEPQIH
ncbi:hypothetical protein [Ammoniphilus sp. CFH 90114]|uniref:hypothetical protein n=1 Tax=Ammoniphilus sp. CFH 90114 TaxID=2493665 RepID=UPI00100E9B54|nr:hypothetical protein [Ammoniphilus sp. CFH 90114]RXT05831.1 hypothetical protein EIZ39_17155 [Ammoniphilus sp. CFH 90114]